MLNKVKLIASWLATSGVALLVAWITNSGWIMTIDTADVTLVNTANSNFLQSAWEVIKFIPTLAMLAWGFYVLNKIFSFVPKAWGTK